jgi:hypothetical protein
VAEGPEYRCCHRLVAQRGDREGVTGRAHPRSNSIAIHFADAGVASG